MIDDRATNWRSSAVIALVAFAVTFTGGSIVCALWIRDLQEPRVTFLGSGSNLSVLITHGPARILLATGDDSVAFENAFLATQPLFARRIDLLLVAGEAASLRVPEAARRSTAPRQVAAIGSPPPSPELEALQPLESLSGHRHIRLSSELSVWIETRLPIGADPFATAEAWRLTIDYRTARIIVYSDGEAVALFPPARPSSITAVSGAEPLGLLIDGGAPMVVANAARIDGPELRGGLFDSGANTSWAIRVHPGDAVQMAFTANGVEAPAWAAVEVPADP